MGRDKRFDTMRNSIVKFGTFWTLQTISVFILLLPVIYIFQKNPNAWDLFQTTGTLVFLVGFVIEWVADIQKSKFKASHPNQLYMQGLYSLVRYPNYLGEILVWLGIWLFGFSFYGSYSWLFVISPIWIFLLLRYISGIPLVEEKRMLNYGTSNTYIEYVKSTRMLIPFKKA